MASEESESRTLGRYAVLQLLLPRMRQQGWKCGNIRLRAATTQRQKLQRVGCRFAGRVIETEPGKRMLEQRHNRNGSPGRKTASRTSESSVPCGVEESGVPAVSSAVMPKRAVPP